MPCPPSSGDLTCYGWLQAIGVEAVSSNQRLDSVTGRFETCAFDKAISVKVTIPGKAGGFQFVSRSKRRRGR